MRSYHPKKTPASNALTDLIRAVLRMSAHAQKVGTILTRDLNLSNARWQTLGELNACQERLTVSQLARLMGLTRQSVQRLINEMAEDGLVAFVENPADQRARHVLLTDNGRATYQDALEREWQWTNAIADSFEQSELERAAALVEAVTRKMERDG